MATTTVHAIERTVQKTREWLADFERELGTDDPAYAWRALSAYLQVIRERLTVDEAAQVGAQLTHLLRGVYYEGFDPRRQPQRIRGPETFLEILAEKAQLDDETEAARVAAAATRMLRHHISQGELEDVLAQMPAPIREVLKG